MDATTINTSAEHEHRVVDYYNEETALYVRSWNREHFHFGIFEEGEVLPEHHHPTQVPALHTALVRMIDRIVGPLSASPEQWIVDAGCGVGGTAVELARRLGARVSGVNICQHQLEIARQRTADCDRVDFRWGDCSRRLPFEDASVDAIVNVESACHYSDRGQFLRECFRVLAPGGRLCAMDWVAADGIGPERYAAMIQPVCDAWTMVSLEDPSGYRERLGGAGFVVEAQEMLGAEVLPNAVLFARGAQQLRALSRSQALTPALQRLLRQFDSLSRAWLSGEFGLFRYVARKP